MATVLTQVMYQQVVPTTASTSPVVRLEIRQAGFGVSDQVEINFYLRAEFQGDAAWRVHLQRDYRGPPGQSEQLDRWIDGGDCPAVALAADALREFQVPKAYGPGDPGRAARMAPHETRHVLTTVGTANGGEVTTVTTDLTGLVLGEFVEPTLRLLRVCLSGT